MPHHRLALAAALAAAAFAAQAQTTVQDAWVRATVANQGATGLFARITSAQGGRLVAVSTPVAGIAEIHEMKLENDVMKMRALDDGLELPAGKAVELKPGGFHVMLMDLKKTIAVGDTVPVTLVVEGADKKRETIALQVPARALMQLHQGKH
jgi:copper(I)-binding protein